MQLFTSQDITWCNRLLVGYMKKQTDDMNIYIFRILIFGKIINLTHCISNNNNNIALIFVNVIVLMLYIVKTKQE